MTARESLIAKLLEAIERCPNVNYSTAVVLSGAEIARIIADLEYGDFAHKALEGGEVPQTLKKQAG